MNSFFKTDKLLQVYIKNSTNGKRLKLSFNICDTDVSDRWIALIKKNQEMGNTLKFNYRKFFTPAEIEQKFQEFKNTVNFINENYDKQIPVLTTMEDLRTNQHLLNDLHEEFEIYGDRLAHLIEVGYFNNPKSHTTLYDPLWPGEKHNFALHDEFLKLNEHIHNTEGFFRAEDNPSRTLCTCLADYLPAGLHEDLKPEDYFLFSPETNWGWIYLGYNTLGKNWSGVALDNDTEVVRRNQVRPQARFASEFYMVFKPESGHFKQMTFYKWWRDNNISELVNPDMKLREFALGFIPIAQIAAYQIDGEPEVRISKSTNKTDWNLNVWSQFDSIENVVVRDL
jgi:hypothetical protein